MKGFLPSESVALARDLEPFERQEAKQRERAGKGAGGSGGRGKKKPSGKFPKGLRAKDKIAAAVGVDRKTLAKAEAVVTAAEAEPEKYEVDAAEIRIRAERRVGELIVAQKETIGLGKPGVKPKLGTNSAPNSRPPELKDAGIDKKLSVRSQQLFAVLPGRGPAEAGEIGRDRIRRDAVDAALTRARDHSRRQSAREDLADDKLRADAQAVGDIGGRENGIRPSASAGYRALTARVAPFGHALDLTGGGKWAAHHGGSEGG